jgi:hypothetical protein
MRKIAVFALAALSLGSTLAKAGTISFAANPNSAVGNFQTPGITALVGYSIALSDDGTDLSVLLTTTDPNASPFANLYFDTIASTPNTGSNLGFEFGQGGPTDAFIPGVNGSNNFNLAGTGVSSVFTKDAEGTTANIVIPNSFFLDNPLNMNFQPTPDGTLVSLHLSQSFSFSVVGGSDNFPAPAELGDAIVSAPDSVPEPASMGLIGIGLVALAVIGKRFTA